MQTVLKGACPSCRGCLEIPPVPPDDLIECAHCGRTTPVRIVLSARQDVRRRRAIGLGLVGLVVLALAALAFHYRGHILSAWGFLTDAVGGRALGALIVAAALLILACALFWMLFPIIIYLSLRDLRRRTAELEKSSELCARHLARLTVVDAKPIRKPADSSPSETLTR